MARINRDSLDRLFDYGISLETKTLYLGYGNPDSDCDVDHELADRVIKGLHILDTIKPEQELLIIMNNEGGSVQHGLAIYDMIKSLQSTVRIHIMGHCYSMAAWILQAADIRTMTPNSAMMIHSGEEGIEGKVEEARNWYRFNRKQEELLNQMMLDKIKEKQPAYTMAKLKKLLSTDTILFAQEALDLGLIDEIRE